MTSVGLEREHHMTSPGLANSAEVTYARAPRRLSGKTVIMYVQVKRLESWYILKSLVARMPNDLHRIGEIGTVALYGPFSGGVDHIYGPPKKQKDRKELRFRS